MLTRIGAWAERATNDYNPWTNVYGLARSLLALATALTLAFNDAATLFPPVPRAILQPPYCAGVRGASAFCVAPQSSLDLVRWGCVLGLLLVASGYRPRLTGPLHAWLSFSFAASSPLLDGGDQIAGILALLLLPVTLADPRGWHWQAPPEGERPGHASRVFAFASLWLIRLQVAGIYFHAAAGKTRVDDWANGTALYYWLRHPIVGTAEPAARVILPLTTYAVPLTLLTWGVIALEFLLASGVLLPRRARPALLAAGITLHLGIMLLHGLISFGLTMLGALVLFLRAPDDLFALALPRARWPRWFGLGPSHKLAAADPSSSGAG